MFRGLVLRSIAFQQRELRIESEDNLCSYLYTTQSLQNHPLFNFLKLTCPSKHRHVACTKTAVENTLWSEGPVNSSVGSKTKICWLPNLKHLFSAYSG